MEDVQAKEVKSLSSSVIISVAARHISEGAVPCPYCLVPCPIIQRPVPELLKKKIFILFFQIFYLFFVVFIYKTQLLFLCFQTADVKMLVTACRFVPMFSSIAHKIFCAKTSFYSRAGL